MGRAQRSRDDERATPPWWEEAVVYQVYPCSFQDSDGDGIGDLPGLLRRLDHLAWLGVDAVRLSPINPSPMVDVDYDVSDCRAVDPVYGSLDDLDRLVSELHHAFAAAQPDLDWRNPEVRLEMMDTLRSCHDRGVDGFRVDVL